MKSMASIILTLMVLCVVVAACGGSRGAGEQLDRADALMDTHPDSALYELNSIDTSRLDEADAARRALLLSQAYDKMENDIADDSLIAVALDYYMSHPGNRHLLARSCYYRGVVAFNANDYQHSIHYLSLADTLAATFGDYYLRGMANAMLARNNARLLDFERDLSSAQAALRYFTLDGDSLRLGSQMLYVAICYLQLDKPDTALSILDNPLCSQDAYTRTSCLLQLGRTDEAEAIMAKHPKLANKPKLLIRYARQFMQHGDIEEAESLLLRAYRYARSRSDSASCLGLKAEILKKQGKLEEYAAMLEEGLADYNKAWNASIHDTHPQGYVETLNSLAGLERASINAQKRIRNVIYGSVIGILLLGLIFGLVFMRMRHKNKISQYEKMLMFARRECEEIEADVKKLRVENEALSEKSRIADEKARYNPDDVEDIMAAIKDGINDVVKRYIATPTTDRAVIADLKSELRKILTSERMQALEYYINIRNNGIITKMRDAGFKESYVKIYMFEQIGFGNYTIAILIGSKTEKTIANNRTYIRKQIAQLLGER